MIRIPSLAGSARVTALTLILFAPGLALADSGQNDAFGSQMAEQATAAARAPRLQTGSIAAGTADEFKLGQNTTDGWSIGPQPGQSSVMPSARVASTVPMVGGMADLVGDHGPQDELARQIYPLGTSANDW